MGSEADFHELVYANCRAKHWFAQTWPDAIFVDARDMVHDERFEVTIPGATRDDVYPRVIRAGWGAACLGLRIAARTPELQDDARRWLDAASALDRTPNGE